MPKSVFFSFYYRRDASRVQQVMQMGTLEGQRLLNSQDWESVKRRGPASIEKWISDQMARKSAVVVLAGAETASRPWVQHEIRYAWDNGKPLVGIAIHRLADLNGRTDSAGENPFSKIRLQNGDSLARHVPFHTPSGQTSRDVYADIARNLTGWVNGARRRT